jgi:hypothetical protein
MLRLYAVFIDMLTGTDTLLICICSVCQAVGNGQGRRGVQNEPLLHAVVLHRNI